MMEDGKIIYSGWVKRGAGVTQYLGYYPEMTERKSGYSVAMTQDIIKLWASPASTSRVNVTVDRGEFFYDPSKPTEAEKSLFELEFGIPFPPDSLYQLL